MQKNTEHGNYQYAYDNAYRLKSAINPTLDNESYTYDKVGNRLSSASTAGNWTYNNSDQLLSTPTDTYEYTANGNTKKITPVDTTQKPSEYIYDARDRLAEVKKDNVSLQKNRYDFQQRRIVKTTAGGETYFLYGETGLLAEYQSNGDFIQGYGYYPNTSYTTNPVYTLKQSGGNYQADFYHNDHLATPQKLTNSTGAVSWAMESNAFGETTIKTQTTKNNLRFPGQYADSDIGLSQNYYRDYAPNLGRYIESDPIGLRGGLNVLAFTNNNPNNSVDVLGLKSDCCDREKGGSAIWAGAGANIEGGFFFYGSVTRLTLVNFKTGEVCSIQIKCGGFGLYFGASAGLSLAVSLNGPWCGKDLAGKSFGVAGEFTIACLGTGGSLTANSDLQVDATGSPAGCGMGVGIALIGCKTEVLGCVNSKCECE